MNNELIEVSTNIQIANENITIKIDKKENIIKVYPTIENIHHYYYRMIGKNILDLDTFKYKYINLLYSMLNAIDINSINILNIPIFFDNNIIDNHIENNKDKHLNNNSDIIINKYTMYYKEGLITIHPNGVTIEQSISDIIYGLSESLYLMFNYLKQQI